jgi:nuclear pore complex protein Nup155
LTKSDLDQIHGDVILAVCKSLIHNLNACVKQDRMIAGLEVVGDEDVPRSLLAACKGAAEPVQRNYDRVLASGAILPKPSLRLRILRSVLTVMREWVMSTLSQRMGTSMAGGPLLFGQSDQSLSNQGMRDKLATTANR